MLDLPHAVPGRVCAWTTVLRSVRRSTTRVVLRHYAFAGHWFKMTLPPDLRGRLTETGDDGRVFAAQPRHRHADGARGRQHVRPFDLFTDVLIRQDGTSKVVVDRNEFAEMLGRGVISAFPGRGAERGLRELLELIGAQAAAAVARPPRPGAVPASPSGADDTGSGTRHPAPAGHAPDLVTVPASRQQAAPPPSVP